MAHKTMPADLNYAAPTALVAKHHRFNREPREIHEQSQNKIFLSRIWRISRLKFRHGGWERGGDHRHFCNTTWGHLLVSLKDYAGRGVKNPYFI